MKATVEFTGALSERKKSAPVAVWLRGSGAAPGEPPEPFDSSFVSESLDLGVSLPFPAFGPEDPAALTRSLPTLQPINVTYSSRHLAISSLLHLKLSLLSPPSSLTIIAVEVFINQRFTAHYEEQNVTANPRPRLYRLAHVRRDRGRSISRPALLADSPLPPSPSPSPGPSAPAHLHGLPIPIPHPGEPRQRGLRRASLVGNGSSPGASQVRLPSVGESGVGAEAVQEPELLGFELEKPDSRDESQEQTWSRGGRDAAVRLEAEEEWTAEAMFRLPTDETIRPSTLKGTQTPLVVTHEVSRAFLKA